MSKFSVGDIIVYVGDTYPMECNRHQAIISINDGEYYTTFLDYGKVNCFAVNSTYSSQCKLAVNNLNNLNYSNGIPIVWEDVV